eukprot:CAMPEP_0113472688 /NCGR_PEP_ID=MMETSP0014_2-20120614/17646_1 /TAXON_ID=2857 /ORGANISM="Nitzschia sp." /LENGTH=410 /DNA_ID=CAMNT_0000365409 /DNA_START=60 /DNA_END=1292 /DNA_ORIENTATION=- /assembly_acc=CAM_ASM_000159
MAGEVTISRSNSSASNESPEDGHYDLEVGGHQKPHSSSTLATSQAPIKKKQTMMGTKVVASIKDVIDQFDVDEGREIRDNVSRDKTTASSATISTTTSHQDSNNMNGSSDRAVMVNDLSAYGGTTLEEQIENFIHGENVVMFNKSWCLFSIDAMSFLTDQLGVQVHSFLLDKHPDGKAIMKYLAAKNNGHKTTPVIFIRGEFLGGFDQVNALYASGRLEDEYLQGLTHADKCQEFITSSNISTKPYFWFPETVDAHVIRMTGILSCLTSLVGAIAACVAPWGMYIAFVLAADYFLRILAGSCFSVLGRIACIVSKLFEPKPRVGRPKQFASLCGFMFAGLASMFYLLDTFLPSAPSFVTPGMNATLGVFTVVGSVFMGLLACATGMEGFLDFCVGCVIFKYGIKLGLIRK